jgi:hypothetical protein
MPSRAIGRRLYFSIVIGVFLFGAFFMAWRDQYQTALTLQRNVEALSKPEFVVERGDQISSCPPDSDYMMTFLDVRVTNHGADSAIVDYHAYFVSKTSPVQRGATVYFSGDQTIQYPGGGWFTFPASAFLYNRTGVIHRGDYIAGKLALQFHGRHCNELHDPDSIITIKVEDYLNHWYEGVFHGSPGSNTMAPGAMQGEPMPIPVENPMNTKTTK